MKTYQTFLQLGIRLTSLGIEIRDDAAVYFCTPKGASVIGWAGVDGIHYCFIHGFGEMVFAVSPMNPAPDYVHPLAKDFKDFLRLLLACGNAAALEQAWMWDQAQFEAFLRENPATEEQTNTLAEIAQTMKLTAMEQPWEYIRSLQSSFDYSKIRYTQDYYDIDMNPAAEPDASEWKVYFEGNFWGHHGNDRAGTEILIGTQFDWAGRPWVVPAVYVCSKGLVVDFCMRVEADEIRAFMETWNLTLENDSCETITQEQQMKLDAENPLCLNFYPRLELNGYALQTSHGCSAAHIPSVPDGRYADPAAKRAVQHYHLDLSCGWVISRSAFLWNTKRRPDIKTLSLTMEQQPERIPGPHFTVKAPGDEFHFIHPVSRTEYTLTLQELEQQTLQKNSFDSEHWLYPTHFTVMCYTLSPETGEKITVSACDDGDKPIEIKAAEQSFAPAAGNAVCAGVIGGADGPTAILFGKGSRGKINTACSGLHFEPVQGDIEWYLTFYEKRYADVSIPLISEGE